jgi:hypothetical protein
VTTGTLDDVNAPCQPSVADRFMAWMERLPGPVWSFYLVLLALLIVIINGVTWLDGTAPFGTFSLYRTSVPFYPVLSLALVHHLNGVARRALAAFRPAMGVSDSEYAQIECELTTMPRRGTWIALGLSLLFTAAYTLLTPDSGEVFSSSAWLFVVDLVIYAIVFGFITIFVYHTVHQLRMVSRIHAGAKEVSLFQSTPLYAFSKLTAQSGIGLLLLNYFSYLTDPATLVNPALIALVVTASLLAVACFVWPLIGMHERLVSEKKRLNAEASTRLEATMQEVFRRADAHDLAQMGQLNQLVASLITTRDELAKISTWPWESRTLAGFISVFLLPLLVRLSTMLLEFLIA